MPAEDLERVFDRFYRTGRGDSQAESTGLGLSICRGIVEAHGGRAYARLRDDGSGTVFTIELPADEEKRSGNEVFDE
jgi:two-component system sensor histidine kinase KdpD